MVRFFVANIEEVVLVDKNDNKVGLMDKLEAHQNPGRLHRAISVLLWRNGGDGKEVLIQKRSTEKPLWPLFWSDTCSTHPLDGESYENCAVRRLKEEMGIHIEEGDLKFVGKMYYQANYNEELSEHELDGLLVGEYAGEHKLNVSEVAEAKWVGWKWLKEDVQENKDKYAPWFLLLMEHSKIRKAMI